MDIPLVSIVIPTTDKELSLVKRCVNSIVNSTYHNTEIIIVNEGKERAEQRNIGIERARGVYVCYLDSDQYVSPGLIEECVCLMKYGYGAIYIPEIITTPGWFAKVRNFERSFYDGTPVDCARFFKRVGCPKFDVELKGPEDSDHDRRLKGIKTISTRPLFHNDGITLLDYIAKKSYYCKSMKRYHEKHPDDRVLKLSYRCFGIFIENHKWKKLIRHPLLSLGVLGILFIRGIIWLRK